MKNKGSVRYCDIREEPKETWRLNLMWCPGWAPGKEKRQLVKTKKKMNKLWTSINNNVSILVRFIIKCTKIMQDVSKRGRWMWSVWEFSVLSSQIFYKSKSVLENKILFLNDCLIWNDELELCGNFFPMRSGEDMLVTTIKWHILASSESSSVARRGVACHCAR